ncbi:MAG TPA: cytochrome-c oxidase [Pseudohongiella sp.]|nr:cytochrome-c oxidase [Pseudohongiella sp.]|tara:strand:- start:65809 stop:67176 length:1368 start_codon:yes stop_codon:yes gene_type:complete
MAIAVVLVLLVVGSVVFHFASPWWFTEIASNWANIDFTVNLTFWVTGFVFIAVNLFLAYSVYQYRQRKGEASKAVYEPENARLETGLTVITTLGVAALLAPGLFVWAQFVTVPEEASEFEAFASQWQWSFRYPGADGQLGTADIQHITETNPWGINPDDPNGQDDVVVKKPYMALSLNEPVKVLLRSRDVLHNYTVPHFRVKMDMVPGMVSYMWLEPTRTGVFDILCEQYCGLGHHIMRGRVEVMEPGDFQAWLANQPTFAETQARPAADVAAGQQSYVVCASCHGQNGEGNRALNAPALAGLQSWYIERQLRYYSEGVRGANPEDTTGQSMAPMANMVNSDAARRNVAAYIETLSGNDSAQTTISGDIDRGARIYSANCAACHGDDGRGSWATDAPALAGMDDWYLALQLDKYRSGIRGQHRDDDYGYQMTSMVKAMRTEEQQNDVIAYINSLR